MSVLYLYKKLYPQESRYLKDLFAALDIAKFKSLPFLYDSGELKPGFSPYLWLNRCFNLPQTPQNSSKYAAKKCFFNQKS